MIIIVSPADRQTEHFKMFKQTVVVLFDPGWGFWSISTPDLDSTPKAVPVTPLDFNFSDFLWFLVALGGVWAAQEGAAEHCEEF